MTPNGLTNNLMERTAMLDQELRTVFTDALGCDIPPGDFARDQVEEWDSLGHVKLILQLEASLGVQVGPEAIPALYTDFATVREFVTTKQAEVSP